MKAFYLFIVIITFKLNLYGQTYTSFIDTNSVWRDVKMIYCSHGSSYMNKYWFDSQEFINGDTLIGNFYHKVYLTGYKFHYYYSQVNTSYDSAFYCNYFIGGLREDSLKHVYFKDTLGTETLLFNFNLTIGDSIDIYAGSPYTFYAFVDSIDSVFIYNGFRKRFLLSHHPPTGYYYPLIEGIGMNYGLLGNAYGSICIYDQLKAYYYLNIMSYSTDTTTTLRSCSIINVPEIPSNDLISLFPNPVIDRFNIVFEKEFMNYSVEIYNVLGKNVYTSELINNQQSISINLSSGIYFVKVSDRRKQFMEKLIVE